MLPAACLVFFSLQHGDAHPSLSAASKLQASRSEGDVIQDDAENDVSDPRYTFATVVKSPSALNRLHIKPSRLHCLPARLTSPRHTNATHPAENVLTPGDSRPKQQLDTFGMLGSETSTRGCAEPSSSRARHRQNRLRCADCQLHATHPCCCCP